MSEAHRLGLEMSMNLSTCGGALRAPWKTGDDAPKSLRLDRGGRGGAEARDAASLPRPQGPRVWDVALLAVRIDDKDAPAAAAPPAGRRRNPLRQRSDSSGSEVVVKPKQPDRGGRGRRPDGQGRRPGPARVGRSGRPLAAAPLPLHGHRTAGSESRRRHARRRGGRGPFQPVWQNDSRRRRPAGRARR